MCSQVLLIVGSYTAQIKSSNQNYLSLTLVVHRNLRSLHMQTSERNPDGADSTAHFKLLSPSIHIVWLSVFCYIFNVLSYERNKLEGAFIYFWEFASVSRNLYSLVITYYHVFEQAGCRVDGQRHSGKWHTCNTWGGVSDGVPLCRCCIAIVISMFLVAFKLQSG